MYDRFSPNLQEVREHYQDILVTSVDELEMAKKKSSGYPVGVAVICHYDQNILMLKKRKGAHAGLWVLPGGGLERHETIHECGAREIMEEANLKITPHPDLMITEERQKPDGERYIMFILTAPMPNPADRIHLSNMEPEKHEEFCWIPYKDLPHSSPDLGVIIDAKAAGFF